MEKTKKKTIELFTVHEGSPMEGMWSMHGGKISRKGTF